MFNVSERHITRTTSYEGGTVYQKSVLDDWSNMLFSMVLQPNRDTFYSSQEDTMNRFIELTHEVIDKHGCEFVCKAAHFSRNVLGLRSISELCAAILNKYQFEGKRDFYRTYFRRPDGIGEVFACIDHLGDKRSHALIRGCADYFETLNEYTLAKYPLQYKKYKLVDIINLTHPCGELIDKCVRGELKAPDTWESKIYAGISDEEKESAWKALVEEHKLGYLALIRNLNNILSQKFATKPWCKEHLVDQIVNEKAIKKSLVFPYQIYGAWNACRTKCPIVIESALEEAFEISIKNMPAFKNSAIILDVSGSMTQRFSVNSQFSIGEISAVYAVALAYAGEFDIYKFATKAKKYMGLKRSSSIFKQIENMQRCEKGLGQGTCINEAFDCMDKHYDNIFIFSDMQVMDGWFTYSTGSAYESFKKFCNQYGSAKLYSFDLGNYHTQVVPQNENVQYVTALNDTIFKIVHEMSKENKSLVDMISEYRY